MKNYDKKKKKPYRKRKMHVMRLVITIHLFGDNTTKEPQRQYNKNILN